MTAIDQYTVITVGQLIEFLSQFNKDSDVWIGDRAGQSNEAVSAYELNDGDVIISPRQDK